MTNPDNAIGTNGAYNGRTSVNAFNDDLSVYSRGILNGWSCVVSSGLTVSLGGANGVRDVAVATDNNGNNTTINNISQSPVPVTISSAPATNSRIDLVVAYADNPPQGTSSTADNPGACGLIVVKGSANASPVEPSDGNIRTAITADGASGTTAYYVVLAKVTIASGTTDLDASNITQGSLAQMNGSLLASDSTPADKVDWNSTKSNIPFIVDLVGPTNTTMTVTSDKGNTYVIATVNAGTGVQINSGASNINKVVTTTTFRGSSNVFSNIDIGIHGSFNNGSTARIKFIAGIKNGNVITPVEKTGTTTASYAGIRYDNTAMTYSGVATRTEWIRFTDENRWYGFFTMNFFANNTTYYGVAMADATDNTSVPTVYQPGTNTTNVTKATQSIEIYE